MKTVLLDSLNALNGLIGLTGLIEQLIEEPIETLIGDLVEELTGEPIGVLTEEIVGAEWQFVGVVEEEPEAVVLTTIVTNLCMYFTISVDVC